MCSSSVAHLNTSNILLRSDIPVEGCVDKNRKDQGAGQRSGHRSRGQIAGEMRTLASRKSAVDLIRVSFSRSEFRGRSEFGMLDGILMGGGHGPSTLHPPYGKGVAQPLVGQVVTAGQLGVHLVALEHLVEEVDVTGSEFEDLDLAKFVRGQRGNDLPQRGESVV